jgi:methionyl-tRNA formyltransferase
MNGETSNRRHHYVYGAALDRGDIILQREVQIGEEETAGMLMERLAHTGAELLMEGFGTDR